MTRAVALLPTYNRPEMAHRAVHLFLAQDYAGPKHLLIVDDGDRRVQLCDACRVPEVELLVWPRTNLPTKRNRMMRYLDDRDAVYFFWDDDDYHGPSRISRQVAFLEAGKHPACVFTPMLYFNSITADLRTSRWVSDATVAFTWAFYASRTFNENVDPGSGFLFVNHGSVARMPAELDYMTVVHAGQRHTPPAFGAPDFWDAPVPVAWAEERLALHEAQG